MRKLEGVRTTLRDPSHRKLGAERRWGHKHLELRFICLSPHEDFGILCSMDGKKGGGAVSEDQKSWTTRKKRLDLQETSDKAKRICWHKRTPKLYPMQCSVITIFVSHVHDIAYELYLASSNIGVGPKDSGMESEH